MIDYSTQSDITALGDATPHLDVNRDSLLSIAKSCRNLVEHQSGINAHKIPLFRHKDYELRTVTEVLQEAKRRGLDLRIENPFENKIIGNCQTISLVCLGIMRELSIPARYRFCLCEYFEPNSYAEHIVLEYWSASSHKWQILDPTVTHEIIEKNQTQDFVDFTFDNIPKNKSNLFTDLWKKYRRGDLDLDAIHHHSYRKILGLERFVWRTLQDVLALHKVELFYWDYFDFKQYVNEPQLVDEIIESIDESRKEMNSINLEFEGFLNFHPYQRDYK
ncbi:transglutaminase domain-containing protein [Serratia marcescens]|nr:transglutaminase domain-containing protein [Serratia marcescens]